MNFVQRLKYAFNPNPARKLNWLAEKKRKSIWLGAQSSRLEADWRSTILSADREIQTNQRLLRGRARDLTKNNPYASRYLDLLDTFVIGADGIRLEPTIKRSNGELDSNTNETIKTAWKRWTGIASLDGKQNWHELTQTMIRAVAQDGEVFVKKVHTKEGLRIQLIDADFLDINLNSAQGNTANMAGMSVAQGNRLVQGVEMDKNGVPKWYWFWENHPDELSVAVQTSRNKRTRVNAKDVIHLYKPKNRVTQTRGITWLASAMWPLNMLSKLEEGELVAVRTSANKMGFIKTGATNIVPYMEDIESDVEGEPVEESIEAQPGMIERLAPGDEFISWNPDHPSTAFGAFVKIILQSIAVALNVSYVNLSGDPNKESFSSAKIHSTVERDYFRCLQAWLSQKVHQNVYEAWLKDELLSGRLKVTSKNVSDFTDVRWVPRQFESIEPVKDAQAIDMMVAMGLATRTEEAAKRGGDYRRNIEMIAAEEQFAAEKGVTLGSKFKVEDNEEELEGADRSVRSTKPVGPFPTFAACVNAMMDEGHSEESAQNICGAMEAED